jgi:hypothetical protein
LDSSTRSLDIFAISTQELHLIPYNTALRWEAKHPWECRSLPWRLTWCYHIHESRFYQARSMHNRAAQVGCKSTLEVPVPQRCTTESQQLGVYRLWKSEYCTRHKAVKSVCTVLCMRTHLTCAPLAQVCQRCFWSWWMRPPAHPSAAWWCSAASLCPNTASLSSE